MQIRISYITWTPADLEAVEESLKSFRGVPGSSSFVLIGDHPGDLFDSVCKILTVNFRRFAQVKIDILSENIFDETNI